MTTQTPHRDTIFQKQKRLEGYLLRHPNSTLYAWYAHQNMEIGKLDRAEKICTLGLKGNADHMILHKLLGDIYLAQGKTEEARSEYALVLQSHQPFPGVIQTYLKNWKSELSPQEETALMRRLSFIVSGNPEVVKFYKLNSDVDRILTRPDHLDFMPESQSVTTGMSAEPEDLDASKMTSSSAEQDEKESSDADAATAKNTEDETQTAKAAPEEGEQSDQQKRSEADEPSLMDEAEKLKQEAKEKTSEKADESDDPIADAPNHHIKVQPTPEPEESKPQKITRSMATFTLMQIFKDQGLYQHALEVLEILKEKSPNTERVEAEIKEIRELMAQQDAEGQS
ncbi:MAG: hypothetical protein K9N34_08315 [Candidatus Marinimicrobia bacterium]|nr:hypothetical protein [Candidatus Neomarinimicrobiota bacterium]MCF7840570.1 hypothetical protein [Candidatus Neomarinimicrobiota bacterium]MCF7902330.1 hypothetical protein [Candidatus Neomarinimicrobiota bacterium]